MRRTRGWTGLRPAVVALGVGFAAASGAARADAISSNSVTASPLLTYSTTGGTGVIGATGVSGTGGNLISYVPVSGSFLAPSNLNLGTFQLAAPTAGSTTYDKTPFSIQLQAGVPATGGAAAAKGDPITITGTLSGTVGGPDQSTVTATFNPLAQPVFTAGPYSSTLTLPNSPLYLVPSSTNGGQTTIQAAASSTTAVSNPVPEPTTAALFAVTLVGLAARRRLSRSAPAA